MTAAPGHADHLAPAVVLRLYRGGPDANTEAAKLLEDLVTELGSDQALGRFASFTTHLLTALTNRLPREQVEQYLQAWINTTAGLHIADTPPGDLPPPP